jgi:hypothetical protein
MSTSRTTTDHDEIRRWAEARGAVPAAVGGTGDEPGHEPDAGLLRLEFRDNESLHEVDWEAFFRTFEDRRLVFLYQEETSDGKPSRFNKFVSRDGDS